jgi:bifunctional DNA-binding transcriptional regulator/antitoxin component of YhaV-PrlF toxin-antitoxin module
MTATLTAGNLHIPTELLKKHGWNGDVRVELEDRKDGILISPSLHEVMKADDPHSIESISDLAGILTKGDPVAALLRDRALDREREDGKFYAR